MLGFMQTGFTPYQCLREYRRLAFPDMIMNHVSLFSGIGGIDLAAEWAGFKTILQVEKNPFCLKRLVQLWPNVRRIERIEDVTAESIDRPVTLVSGGFPCQPFSVAGKRRGKEDDRYLWPQMLRVIQEIRPPWVLGENVANFLNLGLEDAISDLEAKGYEVAPPLVIPAVGVGAPHLRYRVFFVAHTNGQRFEVKQTAWIYDQGSCRYNSDRCDEDVADSPPMQQSEIQRMQQNRILSENVADAGSRGRIQSAEKVRQQIDGRSRNGSWRATKSGICGVAYGIPNRVDRLRALGNAVVPQQVYPILKAIYECEVGKSRTYD